MRIVTIITIVFTFTLHTYHTQENTKAAKWKIGINFSPEIGYRKLVIGDTSNFHLDDIKQTRDRDEVGRFLFTTGALVEYKFSKRFVLKSGFQYTSRGHKSKDLGLGSEYEYPGFGPNLEKLVYSFKYHNIGIPISVSYYLTQKPKVKSFISMGLEMNYLYRVTWINRIKKFNENEYVNRSTESTNEENSAGFNLFTPTLITSGGVDWQCTDRMIFRVEPVFRMGLKRLLATDNLNEYQYNFGCNIGFLYRF